MSEVVSPHIELREGAAGVRPRIAGKGVLVHAIAVWHQELRLSPEQIAAEHGLTLGEVYAALSYYHDHRAELDELIRTENELFEQKRADAPSAFRDKVRDRFGG
jgi:uncharacterized protein (DUF433 family)